MRAFFIYMSVKRSLESYKEEFYKKFPDKSYIEFKEIIKTHFIVKDKFGLCKVAKNHLMNGWMPSIRVALDKNLYITNRIKSIHGDYYDYSLINYTGLDNLISLICPIHGKFEITPHSITSQKAGCNKCGYNKSAIKNGLKSVGWNDSDWYKKAKNSKNFDSFKVYIVECWDENEHFYKIGKTFRTLESRLPRHKERMPYQYKIIRLFEFKELTPYSAKECSILERKLKNENKENNYVPLQNIRGKFECFKQIKI